MNLLSNIKSITKEEDFFLPKSARNNDNVYFMRYLGYDSEKNIFYKRFYLQAQKFGKYMNNNIYNPTGEEVSSFLNYFAMPSYSADMSTYILNDMFIYDIAKKYLNLLDEICLKKLSESMCFILKELYNQDKNNNILKNNFVKFMCWTKRMFEECLIHISENIIPKILYEGEVSKYELHMLRILAYCGCDILILNFCSDTNYLKIDPNSQYSSIFVCKNIGLPKEHYTKIDISSIEKRENLEKRILKINNVMETNSWLANDFSEEIFKPNSQRGVLNNSKIYNLYIKYIGIDEKELYTNRIYKLKNSLESSEKPLVFIDKNIANPDLNEVKYIGKINYNNYDDLISKMCDKLNDIKPEAISTAFQAGFMKLIDFKFKNKADSSLSKIFNYGVKILCWINRYFKDIFLASKPMYIPVFLYYGNPSQAEAEFINMLSLLPIDIVVISPDKKCLDNFENLKSIDKSESVVLQYSEEVFPFPKTEPKIRIATTAYNASQELEDILYNDSGLFRNRQFVRSNPVTLKTTYDELGLLWKEESRFRPGFRTEQNSVVVPNIFAKICGVSQNNQLDYFNHIQNFITKNTILVRNLPFINLNINNPINAHITKLIQSKKILPDKIKKNNYYQYAYLNDNIQDYILEKIQQLIDLNWINADHGGLEYLTLSTLLSLDKNTLHLIQQFDFTKEIPKLVLIDTTEALCSVQECIYILFLNLVGFDIIIFTPTGYRNIEQCIPKNAYEEYQVGQYFYNLNIPNFSIYNKNNQKEGFFSRLFRKD